MRLLGGRRLKSGIKGIVTTSRRNKLHLKKNGQLLAVEEAGFKVITDTCSYYGDTLGTVQGSVITNSAKWAFYAPANLKVDTSIMRLRDCVESGVAGYFREDKAFWHD